MRCIWDYRGSIAHPKTETYRNLCRSIYRSIHLLFLQMAEESLVSQLLALHTLLFHLHQGAFSGQSNSVRTCESSFRPFICSMPQVRKSVSVPKFLLSFHTNANEGGRDTKTSLWIGRRALSSLVRISRRPKCGTTEGVVTLQMTPGSEQPGNANGPITVKIAISTHEASRCLLSTSAADPLDTSRKVHKRALVDFPSTPAERDQWMDDQVEAAATDVVPESVEGDDINSGNFFTIEGTDPYTDPITIGLGATKGDDGKPVRLTSCTALIIMSEKAV